MVRCLPASQLGARCGTFSPHHCPSAQSAFPVGARFLPRSKSGARGCKRPRTALLALRASSWLVNCVLVILLVNGVSYGQSVPCKHVAHCPTHREQKLPNARAIHTAAKPQRVPPSLQLEQGVSVGCCNPPAYFLPWHTAAWCRCRGRVGYSAVAGFSSLQTLPATRQGIIPHCCARVIAPRQQRATAGAGGERYVPGTPSEMESQAHIFYIAPHSFAMALWLL